jgi:putative ABC transport system ATP-binding protein
MPADPPLVRLLNLTKIYGEGARKRIVLDHIDSEFSRGDTIVIRGPSGSGKSTLLNLIAGIDEPTEGSVEIDGSPINALSDRERTLFRRDHIGFVFQFFNLIPTLTVVENVSLPSDLTGSSHRSHAHELLERVGLIERKDDFPELLSGGEQQRVAVARSLMNDPVLLLADEPTGNLDRTNGDLVLDLLTSLTEELGKSLIVATHSRSVAEHATRCYRIDMGKLVEEPN